MFKPRKSVLVVLILFGVVLVAVNFNQPGFSQEDQTIEEEVDKLRETVDELKAQIPKIGYINRQEAFSVFPRAVETERQGVAELEKQMEELNTKAEQGEIDESKYKRQRDLLQAKHLQARIEVDLAMLDTMIKARGFSEITDNLKGLKKQAKPMQNKITELIGDIKDYSVSPQQVSNTLEEVASQQFKQLHDILNNLAQSKITQITQKIAAKEGFDLVVEQQNIILYRRKGMIVDLTDEVIKRLKKELKPE